MQAALAVPGPSSPLDRAMAVMLLSLGTLSTGDDPTGSFARVIRGLAEVRWISRRHRAGRGVRCRPVHQRGLGGDPAGQGRVLPRARGRARAPRPVDPEHGRDDDGDVPRERRRGRADGGRPGHRARGFPGDRRPLGMSLALRGLASYQGIIGDHEGALDLAARGDPADRGARHHRGRRATARLHARSAGSSSATSTAPARTCSRPLRLSEETGSRGGQAMSHLGLSRIARRTGRLDEAKELAERAYSMLDLEAERMAPHGQAMMLGNLARVHVARDELEPRPALWPAGCRARSQHRGHAGRLGHRRGLRGGRTAVRGARAGRSHAGTGGRDARDADGAGRRRPEHLRPAAAMPWATKRSTPRTTPARR